MYLLVSSLTQQEQHTTRQKQPQSSKVRQEKGTDLNSLFQQNLKNSKKRKKSLSMDLSNRFKDSLEKTDFYELRNIQSAQKSSSQNNLIRKPPSK